MKAGVYEIRNLVNGKRYVGSSVNLYQRKHQHFSNLRKGVSHSAILQNAFNKYGEKNLEFAVIEDDIPNEKLIEREQYWIDILRPQYNASPLASSRLGIPHSEETRAKISAIQMGKKRGPHSESHKQNIAKAQAGKYNIGSQRANLKQSKPVRQMDRFTGAIIEEFANMAIAERATGISKSNITNVCKGKLRSAGGFIWRFASDKKELSPDDLGGKRGPANNNRKIAVVQFDPVTGETVNVFRGLGEAERATGAKRANISIICRGIKGHHTAGGFGWRYATTEDQ